MFIVKPKLDREMKIMLRGIKMKLGTVPPHWELYAGINLKRFKMFMQEINYLSSHQRINPDFFTFLRFYIASEYDFSYCEVFNHDYLLTKGYTEEQLVALIDSMDALPLDERHKVLFSESINAIKSPEDFTSDAIDRLKSYAWDDADIFDAIDHASFLFKFSKILKAYLV